MRNILILAIVALAFINACDLFDTTATINQADNARKLKELQWALLIPTASPPATPVSASHSATETIPAIHDEEISTVPEHSESTTSETEHTNDTGNETTTSQEPENTPPGSHGESGIAPVEHDASKAIPTTVAVMAVVDSFTLLPAGEDEDPIELAKKVDLAQRRERVVRQEIQNVLVANTMITVVQPNQEQIAAARAEIAATNSAALSNTMLPSLAETLGVQHVVTALCDLEGEEVNVVAQHAPDGTIVFQDTLIGWEVVLAVAKSAATEEVSAE